MGGDTAEAIFDYMSGLQERIVSELGGVEEKPFLDDRWEGQGRLAGHGRVMLVENGSVLERGGVNFSRVRGESLSPAATARRPELGGRPFEAGGVSLVLHPANPYAPTVHMNVRVFVVAPAGGKEQVCWAGGGMDLTPFYGFDDDCVHFHRTCKEALDQVDPGHYPRFKRWCDEYFQLPHRGEPRGIGGIFYDDVEEGGLAHLESLTRCVGDCFTRAYLPILGRRKDTPYGAREREFQLYRRGRYVEFNLLHDRGTLFGIQSGGRTEAILMSLPPHACWRYGWQAEAGSEEERLLSRYLVGRDWLGES